MMAKPRHKRTRGFRSGHKTASRHTRRNLPQRNPSNSDHNSVIRVKAFTAEALRCRDQTRIEALQTKIKNQKGGDIGYQTYIRIPTDIHNQHRSGGWSSPRKKWGTNNVNNKKNQQQNLGSASQGKGSNVQECKELEREEDKRERANNDVATERGEEGRIIGHAINEVKNTNASDAILTPIVVHLQDPPAPGQHPQPSLAATMWLSEKSR